MATSLMPSSPGSDPMTNVPNPNDHSDHDPNPDLFWLPARLHPEIAPHEFKAFIEEATKPENLLRRTNSALGTRRRMQMDDDPGRIGDTSSDLALGRKKSMLSKVYDPDHDLSSLPASSSPRPSPAAQINRGHSMSSRTGLGRGLEGLESLTINDLQRLESLVLKNPLHSSASADLIDSSEGNIDGFGLGEHRIRAVLRRSMSMGGAAALYAGELGARSDHLTSRC